MIIFKNNELKFLRIKMNRIRRVISTAMALYKFPTDGYNDYEHKINCLESAIK